MPGASARAAPAAIGASASKAGYSSNSQASFANPMRPGPSAEVNDSNQAPLPPLHSQSARPKQAPDANDDFSFPITPQVGSTYAAALAYLIVP